MPRLTDPWFEAAFIGQIKPSGSYRRQGGQIEGAQGVFFYSPCGYPNMDGTHGIVVAFANPCNAPPVPPEFEPLPRWTMMGTGLGDLSLHPSVNCQDDDPKYEAERKRLGLKPGECRPGRKCWHGFVTNGEVR